MALIEPSQLPVHVASVISIVVANKAGSDIMAWVECVQVPPSLTIISWVPAQIPVNVPLSEKLAPLSTLYCIGVVPPVAVISISPLQTSYHDKFVVLTLTTNGNGSVTVAVEYSRQPIVFVTTKTCVPAQILVNTLLA